MLIRKHSFLERRTFRVKEKRALFYRSSFTSTNIPL
nr:MAG TPA: hypothetical protein [Bacteriophage sp.]